MNMQAPITDRLISVAQKAAAYPHYCQWSSEGSCLSCEATAVLNELGWQPMLKSIRQEPQFMEVRR